MWRPLWSGPAPPPFLSSHLRSTLATLACPLLLPRACFLPWPPRPVSQAVTPLAPHRPCRALCALLMCLLSCCSHSTRSPVGRRGVFLCLPWVLSVWLHCCEPPSSLSGQRGWRAGDVPHLPASSRVSSHVAAASARETGPGLPELESVTWPTPTPAARHGPREAGRAWPARDRVNSGHWDPRRQGPRGPWHRVDSESPDRASLQRCPLASSR